jgi:hypothetical protein
MSCQSGLNSEDSVHGRSDNMVAAEGGFEKMSEDDAIEDTKDVTTITDRPIQVQRKLIWSADLEFQVKNVDASTKSITKMSERFDGFISGMELTNKNYQISNQITVRVPNSNFHALINAMKDESIFLDRANVYSDDVTEEFVDIESRLKTKREIRDRYIQILRDKTGSISDVLEAEEAIRTITEELKQKKVVYAF